MDMEVPERFSFNEAYLEIEAASVWWISKIIRFISFRIPCPAGYNLRVPKTSAPIYISMRNVRMHPTLRGSE